MADLHDRIKYYKVKLELTSHMLGTVPKNKQVFTTFIASKAMEEAEKRRKAATKAGLDPDTTPAMASGEPATPEVLHAIMTEEPEGVVEAADREERGSTGFMEDVEGRYVLDYVVRGFLSAAAQAEKTYGPAGKSQIKQLNDKVKKYLFVHEKRVRINEIETPEDEEDFDHELVRKGADGRPVCERPLRAQTALGPRVTVTRSDVVLAGATLEFHLKVMDGGGFTKAVVESLLQYGEMSGLAQWRSGGFGQFTVVELETVDELPERVKKQPMSLRKAQRLAEEAKAKEAGAAPVRADEPKPAKKPKST